MKYVLKDDSDSFTPRVELTRRNLNTLLDKLNDPLSMRILGSPIEYAGQGIIFVKAVEDEEHYANRAPGAIEMPSGDPLSRLIEQMKDQQHRLCAYGTREGDGGTCDCKYARRMFLSEPFNLRGEITGCCEMRAAIQVLVRLQEQEKEKTDG